MDHWLIRTENNIIAGPYSRDQVIQLIEEGKIGLQDEVCQASHYWICLHEQNEVQSQLGIQMPRRPRTRTEDEEVTETQTDAAAVRKPSVPKLTLEMLPPSPDIPDDYEGGTAVMSRGGFRQSHSHLPASGITPAPAPVSAVPAIPEIVGVNRPAGGAQQIERQSVWRGFAWLLVVAACLIVYAVLRILHASQY